jgi:hypothetical protein
MPSLQTAKGFEIRLQIIISRHQRVVQLNFLFGGKFGILVNKSMAMNTLTIDKKKYVVLPEKEYEDLRTKAVSKSASARKLSLSEGKKLAYKLIDKWAKEK